MPWLPRILLAILLPAALAVAFAAYSYYTPRAYEGPKTVVIPKGSGARQAMAALHGQGVVPAPLVTLPFVLLSGDYRRIKAGEYAFESGLSPAEIIAKMVRGEVVVHKVTIPEGWTRFQVAQALLAEPLLTGEVPAFAEGSLLPDTMHFERGESRASVIARMQQAQVEMLEALWAARATNLPFTTRDEALVLASIIERETGVADERTLVSGVFVNRLRKGMLLQTDPSVAYGIEVAQGGAPMGRALTRADLQRDTPYNTYTRAGLPPGPICNPGRAAIAAALNPATTDAFYFVATGNGGHRFAATLNEHNDNVADYRRALKGEP